MLQNFISVMFNANENIYNNYESYFPQLSQHNDDSHFPQRPMFVTTSVV